MLLFECTRLNIFNLDSVYQTVESGALVIHSTDQGKTLKWYDEDQDEWHIFLLNYVKGIRSSGQR